MSGRLVSTVRRDAETRSNQGRGDVYALAVTPNVQYAVGSQKAATPALRAHHRPPSFPSRIQLKEKLDILIPKGTTELPTSAVIFCSLFNKLPTPVDV